MTTEGIFELSDRVTTELCELDPLIAISKGVPGHADRWPDFAPEGVNQKRDFWANLTPEVEECEVSGQRETVAKSVLLEECRTGGHGTDVASAYDSLTNIASPWQMIRASFEFVPHDTAEDWDALLTRLHAMPSALRDYQRSLQAQVAAGSPPAQRQVLTAIEQGEQVAQNSSFDLLVQKLSESEADATSLAAPLQEGIANANLAYAEMTEWLRSDYLPVSAAADAVGHDAYLKAARQHLGTVIDPLETYEWGWAELHRLRRELAVASNEIEAGASPDRALHLLRTDPARAAQSIDEFITIMKDRQATALDLLQGDHFEVPEQIRSIDVKVDPPGGALAAHYTGPSEDFSRPGTVWYPVSDRSFFPLYEEVTTAYHEGFPGHHLQVGWQVAMGDELSRFHRLMVWYPGSGEGWALYAEHLMGELGFLEKPDFRIGLLASQLLRTCRVVIDIGCHLGLTIPEDSPFHPGERWSYELGRQMLEKEAYAEPEMAESEIVRYLGWPGQAISYKLGERVILDLRDQFDRAGISRREFHKQLLSVGSIGLDLTRKLVKPA